MKMSIIKKKWKSAYEMYLKDTRAHSHHSCILSTHVKGYKNLQCVADRNRRGANISSTSETATAVQGKGLQLFLLPQALVALQGQQVIFYVAHFIVLFSIQ